MDLLNLNVLNLKFGNFLGSGYEKFIPHEYPSSDVDDLSLSALGKKLIKMCVS